MIKTTWNTVCCALLTLLALTSLAHLVIGATPTWAAQSAPPAGTPVITLTVAQGATVSVGMSADATTPVWVESTPLSWQPETIGTDLKKLEITATGTTINIYGAITNFYCSDNSPKLISLDVHGNPGLKMLTCSVNDLTSLDVRQNIALEVLDCGFNQLTTLDVSKNTRLEYLKYQNNPWRIPPQVDPLRVRLATPPDDTPFIALELEPLAKAVFRVRADAPTPIWVQTNLDLYTQMVADTEEQTLQFASREGVIIIHGNITCFACDPPTRLTSLDVSHNSGLQVLRCGGDLTTLDVSKNVALKELDCGGNQLTTLDVSRNPALLHLDCTNNKLTSLILSKKAALEHLQYSGNPLTEADIQRR